MALTKVKSGNILLTTPAASSNDVTPATTAYVTTALANMVDSAPSTLNTLNELAAALGDDANFSTTVTNSIATKLPLAGGTMTGNITSNESTFNIFNNDIRFKTSGAETMVRAVANGAVELMYDNSTKIATESGGVHITGYADADNFKIAGAQGSDGQVLTSTGSGVAWENAAGGATTIDGLSDATTSETNSIMLGTATHGTINGAAQNTSVGIGAMDAITSAEYTVAIGYNAGTALTSGSYNTAVGGNALITATDGHSNTAIGMSALKLTTSGDYNTAVGRTALQENTTGSSNTAMGHKALYDNISGAENVAMGKESLYINKGSNNTAVGTECMKLNTDGEQNAAFGKAAMISNTTSSYNVAVGAYSGYAITTAAGYGTYLGYNAGKSHTAGRSVFIGEHAGFDSTSTDDSVFIGRLAGENVTTGYTHVIIGDRAGKLITTGYNHTLIGYKAGDNIQTGYASIIIGSNDAAEANSRNEIVIGAGLGGKGYHQAFIGGVNGIYNQPNSSSWSTTSDRRIKKNIHDYTLGLDVLKQIRVRNFEYRELEEMELGTDGKPLEKSELPKGNQVGVIAQEIQDILPSIVRENETNGRLSVDNDEVTWLLVKAVQELSAKVEELQNG